MASAEHRNRPGSSAAEEAWALLLQLMMRQRGRFVAVAAEMDLHSAQADALLRMEPDTPVPMNELATLLNCDSSNVTGIVDRLEARGLVARRPDERDRRVKRIVLTPLGVELRARGRAAMNEAPEAFKRLSRADLRALRNILERTLKTD